MNELLDRLRDPFREFPFADSAWVVGGAVRDAFAGIASTDADIVVRGDAESAAGSLARATRGGRFLLSKTFGSWRVHGGSLPFTVDITPLQGADLTEDLSRRDFTVNAVAVPIRNGVVVDPYAGQADRAAARLRMVDASAFRRDPVRLMRLVRLARQHGFTPEPATVAQARIDAALVNDAPPERVMDELVRIVHTAEAWRGFELMDEIGVLGALVPQLDEAKGMQQSANHHKDVFGHVMEVVRYTCELVADPEPVFRSLAPRVSDHLATPLADQLTRGQALVLAAVFHDVAKPATRGETPEGYITFIGHDQLGVEMAERWCDEHRTSRQLARFIADCVRHHLVLGFLVRHQPLSLRQIDRYLRTVEPVQVEQSVLTVADRLAARGPRFRQSAIDAHLALSREVLRVHFDQVDNPVKLPIDGAEISKKLGIEPGPWLKDLLVALREEQLVRELLTSEKAFAFAESWVSKADMRAFDHRHRPNRR